LSVLFRVSIPTGDSLRVGQTRMSVLLSPLFKSGTDKNVCPTVAAFKSGQTRMSVLLSSLSRADRQECLSYCRRFQERTDKNVCPTVASFKSGTDKNVCLLSPLSRVDRQECLSYSNQMASIYTTDARHDDRPRPVAS